MPAVAQRIRSLTEDQLSQLLDYERAHADRPTVIQILHARLAELRAGAEPSGGRQQEGPDRPGPAAPQPADITSATAGPPSSPPPHGTPNQPARPKADKQSR